MTKKIKERLNAKMFRLYKVHNQINVSHNTLHKEIEESLYCGSKEECIDMMNTYVNAEKSKPLTPFNEPNTEQYLSVTFGDFKYAIKEMKTYKVKGKQTLYVKTYVEATSEKEAKEIIENDDEFFDWEDDDDVLDVKVIGANLKEKSNEKR
tara:strand:- start:977 stop:1429 length:453 start_codon:yes stop_codon:yes gene_type:complete